MPARVRLLLLVGLVAGCGDDVVAPPGEFDLELQTVATGLQEPVLVTAPFGDTRLFVVEQRGVIRVVRNGTVQPAPFLDLRSKVSTGGERGLLGLAFHPGYGSNGVFVVNYTNAAGDTRISSFKVSGNPDVANPASEQVILAIQQPFANHNGGHVVFGPLGNLYIGMGDGGGAGDYQREWAGLRVQDLTSFGEDGRGELYVISGRGTVSRIVRKQ